MTAISAIDGNTGPESLRLHSNPHGYGTILHYVDEAAHGRCQAVFTVRGHFMTVIGTMPVVTYNRVAGDFSPLPHQIRWSDYESLLAEAEMLCGGSRKDGTVRPDWLPEGVEAVTIRWTGEVAGTRNDTFALVLEFGSGSRTTDGRTA